MLRRARAEDAPEVADVYLAAFRTLTFLPVVHRDDETREWVAAHLVPETEVWVEEEEGRIVGFIALADDFLAQMYVHPGAQNRGIGSRLIAKAKEERPAGLQLWVFQQNERARRFYERHGFRCVQLTDGSGNEERTPDARYVWRRGTVAARASPARATAPPLGDQGSSGRSRSAGSRWFPRRSR